MRFACFPRWRTASVADGRVELTLARGIRAAAARWPTRPAIEAADGRLTYGELARRLRQARHVAEALGLVPGDRIAFVAANHLRYIEVVAGLAEAGVIVATLLPRQTEAEFAAILGDCGPRLLIAETRESPAAAAADRLGIEVLGLETDWPARLANASDGPAPARALETDSFALSYTSGTTGTPKGVMLSHRSRALTFLAMAVEYGCFSPGDRFLVLTPMAHGAGFVFAAAPLFFGGTAVLGSLTGPEAILERLAEPDINGVFLVPTLLQRMADCPADRWVRGSGLKAVVSNAAALPQRLKEIAIDRWGEGLLHETYGATEAGIVTNIRPAELRARPGSVGTPFPLIEIALRDSDGMDVPDGEPGELFVRGPYAFNGYWQRPDETARTLVEGWVTVGDVATRDPDGFVTIVDRKKDMVVTGGVNVYPREVERVLEAVPGVREVAVVGLPDPEWGERLHAFIVGSAAEAQLLAAARASLASAKIPKGFTRLDALPRSGAGKILKRTLRDMGRDLGSF